MNVKPAVDRRDLRKRTFRTNDIMNLVQEVIKTDVDDTEELAKMFTPDRAGLKALFNFVDRNFRYKEDPAGSQWVQTPSYLWRTKVGDCKSYTVFTSSILQNMGVLHLIRYTAYRGRSQFRHVYPVAILDGKEIPLDVVWKKQERGRFGHEKSYKKKKDFRMEKGLYKLGNTSAPFTEEAIIGKLESDLASIEAASASIPDLIDDGPGDVGQMTAGEVDRMIWAERYLILAEKAANSGQRRQYEDASQAMTQGDIAGIGSLRNDPFGRQVELILAKSMRNRKPAFPNFTIRIPNPIPARMSGLFKNVGKFINKVTSAIKNAYKKVINFVFKGAGMLMGPFFIFKFLNRNKIKSPKIKARLRAQDKSYNFIQKIGKFDDKQLKGIMLNGIIKKTGKTPTQIAQEGGAPQVGAVAALIPVIVNAIKTVFSVIGKIAGIFKKKSADAGVVDQSTMSDPTLFEEEARLQAAGSSGGGPSGEGGGFNPLILAAGIIPFILK